MIRALLATIVALVAGAVVATSPAFGVGAQYTVLKCHINSRGVSEAIAEVNGNYATQNRCSGSDRRLEISNTGFATAGQAGFYRFNAPAGTEIVGVRVRANLRRENHHLAQLSVINSQNVRTLLANGPDTGDGFQTRTFGGLDHVAFVVHLTCSDGGGCPKSDQAHAYVQDIELTLADRVDPKVTSVSGSLMGFGWRRGSHAIYAQGADVGSGLRSLVGRVNGAPVGSSLVPCSGLLGSEYSSLTAPCPRPPFGGELDVSVQTDTSPFVNGPNEIKLCVVDFAGNAPACALRTVYVDNAPPALEFTNDLLPEDPELMRAAVTELHSGLAATEIAYRRVGSDPWIPLETVETSAGLRARVDSTSVPAGDYEFRASAGDVAGNEGVTTQRADGTPMVLTFPLLEKTQLSARFEGGASQQTVPYRAGSEVSGRLTDATGDPLGDREIVVDEYFGVGALIDHRRRTVTTNSEGRWSSKLPAGPSRTVSAHFTGSKRFLANDDEAGRLDVRSRASFRTSRPRIREGRRVVFAGRVAHFGARIPTAGKLVELQVRESARRWNTVREAFHTKQSGRFRLGYRFGRFYETDTKFRFRVKIAREQGWPYKAPVRSRSRTVTVLAK